jgi:hypothetical protein
MSTVTGWEE